MQPELFEHFHSKEHNGFLQDCSITLIDKTDGSDPTRREEYWRVVLKTVAPYGLNRFKVIHTYTSYAFFRDRKCKFRQMYYHFGLFHCVLLLVEKLVIPGPCLVYYRGQKYLPRGFPMGYALEMCGGFWG